MHRQHIHRAGMTFIEVAVVSVLLGLTNVLAIPKHVVTAERARRAAVEQDLQAIRRAELHYFQRHHAYTADPRDLGLAWPTVRGYTYAISQATATSFQAAATPRRGRTLTIGKDGVIF